MDSKQVRPRVKKGLWKPEEDLILKQYVETHGEGNWATVSERSGLMRGGKSCRLRWKNYLRPNIKRGEMSEEEQDLIIRMHKLLGNRWSLIAGRLPGRTDNEVKNYWNTHLNKKCPQGKRKSIDSNNNYNDMNDKKKLRRLRNSETIHSSSSRNTTGGVYERPQECTLFEESSAITNTRPWTEDTTQNFFNYDIETPLVPATGTATFAFDDDEPFNAYLHSFFLFEEECNIAEETYSQVGLQTLVP